jgi:transposase
MIVKRGFLDSNQRAELFRVAKNGLEQTRVSRRAHAILLLDKGMSYSEVAEVLFLDQSTVREWHKAYDIGGVDALDAFDFKGGFSPMTAPQMDAFRAWATETLPESTTVVGQFLKQRFDLDYTRSGLIKLMYRIGFAWKKPETVPGKIDAQVQQRFIDKHEDLRNSLGPDETIVYVDAVHPTHRSDPGGCWLPKDGRCAVASSSGRDRLNLHGAIDLETGMTRIVEVLTVDAQSTIALFESLERAYPQLRKIHVFLDNARYHHAKLVREWLMRPGRRIVLHFVPAYCPHLNPIERLWLVMHKHVTHRRSFAKFRDYADAMLTFLRETVPQNFEQFSSIITDNFRVIDPKDFRILA